MPAAGVTDARIYGVGIDIPRILEALGTLDPQPVYAEVRSIVQQLTGLACNLPAPAGVANVSH